MIVRVFQLLRWQHVFHVVATEVLQCYQSGVFRVLFNPSPGFH